MAASKYAIIGCGVTELGHVDQERSVLQLEAEAARLAIEDAGLVRGDIGVAVQMTSDFSGSVRTRHDDSFARVLGLPVNLYMENVGRGGEYATLAIMFGMKALDLGLADYVVAAGARDDWSRSRRVKRLGGRGTGQLHMPKEGAWGKPNGSVTAASFHSLLATRHMSVYGTTHRQLGSVAVAQRAWANMNPQATMYEKRLTIDDYEAAPFIVWPYRIFDFSQQSDGGVAFVLTTADRALGSAHPLFVRGIGFGEQMAEQWWNKENYASLPVATARDAALRQAGIQLTDLDFAQLYDCFTAEVIIQLEDYGWCEKGEGGAFVDEGHTTADGEIPVNTGGGLLSAYHLGNLTGLVEAVTQLRGEAGDRQLPGATIGLVSGHGGEVVSGGMCSIHSSLILSNDQG
jgi:acetyl-CoA acetyltransferase